MKKHIFLLGIAIIMAAACFIDVQAQSDDLNSAIKMYKSGNYSECIQTLETVLKNDPSNAAAHYYMAIASAQAGRSDDAISHYDTVIRLNSQETLVRYALKGKLCLEDAEKCSSSTTLDEFIRARNGFDMTNAVKNAIETQNLDSLRRDINDNKEIEPARLKQYRNFSSLNDNGTPTNDEIVAALRILQRAGLNTPVSNPYYSDISALYAGASYPNSSSAADNLVNLMTRMSSSNNSNVDPRVLQSVITSQMMTGF